MSGVFSGKCENSSRPAKGSQSDSRVPLVDALRQQLGKWGPAATEESPTFSCGAAAVDRLLPGGGLRHGMLVEWVGVTTGGPPAEKSTIKQNARGSVRTAGRLPVAAGGATLGLLAAREACREGGMLVLVDRDQTFYPPAAAAWGVDLERLLVVRPQNARDELWAAVQALRSPVVAAVWAFIDRIESRAFRRLQLAAEAGRTLGSLVRPPSARGQPTWAEVRLEVRSSVRNLALGSRPLAANSFRCVHVQVSHCHSGCAGGAAMLEIDDVAHAVRQMNSADVPHSLSVVS